MFRSITLLALALTPTAALAEPMTGTVSVDGDRVEYVTRLEARDIISIKGRSLRDGQPFRLTVAPHGRVRGQVASTPVSFMITKAQRERLVQQLRARRSGGLAMAAAR